MTVFQILMCVNKKQQQQQICFKPETERTHVIKHTPYEFGSHMTTEQGTNAASTAQCSRHFCM